ncbi:MAG: hypothetical protein ACLGIM_23020, partial [Alphaproteobacteria bacterium]
FAGKPRNMLWFNIAGFIGRADEIELKAVLQHRYDGPIRTFRALVLHEVRHFFQSHLYSRYFYARDRDTDATGGKTVSTYKRSPVELDAAWTHHLEDHQPSDYASVSAYVDAVMTSYAGYKSLRGFERAHFRRKTARYYFEMTKGSGNDALRLSAKDRLAAMRTAMRKEITDIIGGHTSDIDLRAVEGYDAAATRFYFPGNAIRSVTGMVAKGATFKPETAPIVFFVMALLMPADRLPAVARYLKASGITKQDAITHAENAFKGGFDSVSMTRLIAQRF